MSGSSSGSEMPLGKKSVVPSEDGSSDSPKSVTVHTRSEIAIYQSPPTEVPDSFEKTSSNAVDTSTSNPTISEALDENKETNVLSKETITDASTSNPTISDASSSEIADENKETNVLSKEIISDASTSKPTTCDALSFETADENKETNVLSKEPISDTSTSNPIISHALFFETADENKETNVLPKEIISDASISNPTISDALSSENKETNVLSKEIISNASISKPTTCDALSSETADENKEPSVLSKEKISDDFEDITCSIIERSEVNSTTSDAIFTEILEENEEIIVSAKKKFTVTPVITTSNITIGLPTIHPTESDNSGSLTKNESEKDYTSKEISKITPTNETDKSKSIVPSVLCKKEVPIEDIHKPSTSRIPDEDTSVQDLKTALKKLSTRPKPAPIPVYSDEEAALKLQEIYMKKYCRFYTTELVFAMDVMSTIGQLNGPAFVPVMYPIRAARPQSPCNGTVEAALEMILAYVRPNVERLFVKKTVETNFDYFKFQSLVVKLAAKTESQPFTIAGFLIYCVMISQWAMCVRRIGIDNAPLFVPLVMCRTMSRFKKTGIFQETIWENIVQTSSRMVLFLVKGSKCAVFWQESSCTKGVFTLKKDQQD
ncbi:hypothetical protein CEXT_202251 [Caerostris extrusa]|uniref:Uncharacterized protein n=1 Tax=Caerostris extrusa TaxID=172846 RepID=A0AAV4T5V8_CAEEX|nr:hypothetical protein CEXT_202251 [Caerostris extrusa]